MTTAVIESSPVPRTLRHNGAAEPVAATPAPAAMDQTTLMAAYGAHREAAYRLAYRILGDGAAAEDAVQDAFIKLWIGAAQFDPSRGSMLGLVLTIARHTSIDVIRRRVTRQRTESTYCIDDTWTSDGPERESERGEDARNLRSALVKLPTEQRSVIEMAYFTGLTRREIAAHMTIPIGTVKSRMRLGMQKLAFTLGDDEMRLTFDREPLDLEDEAEPLKQLRNAR